MTTRPHIRFSTPLLVPVGQGGGPICKMRKQVVVVAALRSTRAKGGDNKVRNSKTIRCSRSVEAYKLYGTWFRQLCLPGLRYGPSQMVRALRFLRRLEHAGRGIGGAAGRRFGPENGQG